MGVAGRQFPWQLSLSTGWLGMFYQHRCGAALITRRHALTAAHCLAGRGSWWSLPGAGLYLLAGFRTHQQRDTAAVGRVVRYTLHPQFVSSTYEQVHKLSFPNFLKITSCLTGYRGAGAVPALPSLPGGAAGLHAGPLPLPPGPLHQSGGPARLAVWLGQALGRRSARLAAAGRPSPRPRQLPVHGVVQRHRPAAGLNRYCPHSTHLTAVLCSTSPPPPSCVRAGGRAGGTPAAGTVAARWWWSAPRTAGPRWWGWSAGGSAAGSQADPGSTPESHSSHLGCGWLFSRPPHHHDVHFILACLIFSFGQIQP